MEESSQRQRSSPVTDVGYVTLWKLDACAQAELVRKGEIAPIELVESAIRRIDELDPRINAVITPLFESALTEARDVRSVPFSGVPLLLKDFLCETAGDPYFEGSAFLRNIGWRAPADSPLAVRFRAAGFIIIGKTNVPEFAASATTEPAAFGPTRNPWNLEHSAGGSSGGSAAAVASGMVSIAHANDGTGSIRIPAACCGLVGLKPSSLVSNVVEHVVTRSVRDAAALLDVVCDAPVRQKTAANPGRLRVGFLRHDPLLRGCLELRPGIRDSNPASEAAVVATAHLLESLGHIVEESYPPALDGPTGLGGARGIIAANEVAARLDGWIARAGRSPAPNELEPATWAIVNEGRKHSTIVVEKARARLSAGVRPIRDWWADGFDLLLTPVTNGIAPRIGEFAELELSEQNWRLAEAFGLYTVPYSFTGQPAISLPAVWTSGMPIGIQLVADYGCEDVLIRVASQIEEARPWSDRWPQVSQSVEMN